MELVARSTPGFSGADLENLINEAALNAARTDKDGIEQEDLEYARDRIAFGREKKTGSKAMPEEERRLTAYHEAGHALIQHSAARVRRFAQGHHHPARAVPGCQLLAAEGPSLDQPQQAQRRYLRRLWWPYRRRDLLR